MTTKVDTFACEIASSNATTYAYDTAGNLTTVYSPLISVTTGGTAHNTTPTTSFTYDQYGNELMQTDANGHTTSYQYDSQGRKIREILPMGQSESWTYDALGRLSTSTDFDGNVTTYHYDNLGRTTSVVYTAAAGSGKSNQTVSYTYDALGRQHTITDPTGTTTYTYDNSGNLITVASPQGTINYVYNTLNQHTETYTGSTGSPQASTTDTVYTYDVLGRLYTMSVTKLNGSVLGTPLVTTYYYDANGNLARQSQSNGQTTDYTYNSLNEVTNITQKLNSTTIATYAYTYDADGRKLTEVETDGSHHVTSTWTYNADGMMIREQIVGNGSNENADNTYRYDAVGNRLATYSQNGNVLQNTFTYNANDELATDGYTDHSDQDNTGHVSVTYNYDANGSLVETDYYETFDQSDDSSWSTGESYDVRNRMIRFSNGTPTTYTYDDAGNLVKQVTGSTTTTYLVDTNNPTGYAQILEQHVNGSATPSVTYFLGNAIDGQANGSTVIFLLRDGRGYARMLANASGNVIGRYTFDAYGNTVSSTASMMTTHYFPDGYLDSVSGLTFHSSGRQSQSSTGVFIERDGEGYGNNSDPISLHKYLYAGADPIDGNDPTGHDYTLTSILVGSTVSTLLDLVGLSNVQTFYHQSGINPFSSANPDYNPKAVSQFFNSVGDELAVVGGFARGFVEGAAQGFFNVINGIQDAVIGVANLAIKAELAMLGPVGLEFNPSIPSPDWSYGLIYNEPPTQHAVSKFLGGIGASLASSGGFGLLGTVGEGGEAAAVSANELTVTETVAKNIATRPYINSRLLVQEIMDAKPPIPDPGGASGPPIVGGLKWIVEGAYNGSKGVYDLVVNPATKQIVHFVFKST